jgi:peptidyl-dipeptidase Dcp
VLTKGVFFAAGKLYGLTFKQRTDLPVYNPDMLVYDVFNEDGKQLAIFRRPLRPQQQARRRLGECLRGQSGLLNRNRSSRIT